MKQRQPADQRRTEEILDLSDRIAVIFKGRILGTLDRRSADSRKIGILMAGVHHDEAV